MDCIASPKPATDLGTNNQLPENYRLLVGREEMTVYLPLVENHVSKPVAFCANYCLLWVLAYTKAGI